MPKRKLYKEEDNEIPMFSKYEYSQTLTGFTESDKLMENELNSLECYLDCQLGAQLNSFNDQTLNNHLYVIYGTKKQETIIFMRQWVCFFVHQHRTKMTERVKDYLETKKLTLDGWLSAIKYGRWGDIMTVYVLSLVKGIQMCIHLRNGKVWSTLHAGPIHHTELIE